MNASPDISAMLPVHQRIEKTLETLRHLNSCTPPPAEILVHVASSQVEMIKAVEDNFPDCRILVSDLNLGPGGARNRMLREARNELVASFDDDSYPVQPDFFARLADRFQRLPEASILALNIYETGQDKPATTGEFREVPQFVGCGCAYRRSYFLESDGYVPIPIAYSMEEADLALRYAESGRRIYYVPDLLIYHDTVLSHHASPMVAAMQVANTALFVYLRYPLSRYPLGLGQVLNKWLDTLRRGRLGGSLLALPCSFLQFARYGKYRKPVRSRVLDQHRNIRKHDERAG